MWGYRVCMVGGACGHRMMVVYERLKEKFETAGYPCQLTHHSIWENYSAPPPADLILQLLPAYTEAEAGCPVVNIRPLLADFDHEPTLARIAAQIEAMLARPSRMASALGLDRAAAAHCH
jgi:hypothetical protein